jgi:hypothetical protein
MRKKALEALRRNLFLTRTIQGLYSPTEALLSFWDLKLTVDMANSAQSQNMRK